MSTMRFKALEASLNRVPRAVEPPSEKISDYYGKNVFDRKAMAEYMPSDLYKEVVNSIDQGIRIERKLMNHVASAMKAWAIEKKVTHYTHWFQPLTGSTAEKHDTFFETVFGSTPVEKFKLEAGIASTLNSLGL